MPRALRIGGLLILGAVTAESVRLGIWLSEHARSHVAQLPAQTTAPLTPFTIDPSWVIEGSPVIRSAVYATSPDGKNLSGIWECVGPSRFRWHFQSDESIYVLEGMVNIEVDGTIHSYGPGDTAYFPAGMVAIWHIPGNFKKSFTLHEPGRVDRWLRKFL